MTRPPLLAAVLGALFVLVGLLVLSGATRPLDAQVLAYLRWPGEPGTADLPRWLVAGALILTKLGAGDVRAPLAVVSALVLLFGMRTRSALAVLVGWAGESLLVELIKTVVNRARPDLAWRLTQVHQASFPSGHAAGSMMLYPLLGCLLGRLRSRSAGRIGTLAGMVLAFGIGVTRVILGVHWASDVAAGWLLGGAVAALAARAEDHVAWQVRKRRD